MLSLSETQFWFVAAGVAPTPMLNFWIADGIGWFLRRTLWPCPETELSRDVSQQATNRPASQSEPAGRGVDCSGAT